MRETDLKLSKVNLFNQNIKKWTYTASLSLSLATLGEIVESSCIRKSSVLFMCYFNAKICSLSALDRFLPSSFKSEFLIFHPSILGPS